MALVNLGDDPWLLELEACEKLYCDIMEQLMVRKKEPRSTQKYAQISTTIRMRLKQYKNEVEQLKFKNNQAIKTQLITYEENERRNRQIDKLESKHIQIQKLFDEHNINLNQTRSRLLDTAGTSEWNSDDDALIGAQSQYSVNDLRSQQNEMLKNQEEGLESLSKIISRQKTIAQTITSEVDFQNEIIDDLGDHIDRTDTRVRNETRNVTLVDNKDKTCIYWTIIILLFISIIVVALL